MHSSQALQRSWVSATCLQIVSVHQTTDTSTIFFNVFFQPHLSILDVKLMSLSLVFPMSSQTLTLVTPILVKQMWMIGILTRNLQGLLDWLQVLRCTSVIFFPFQTRASFVATIMGGIWWRVCAHIEYSNARPGCARCCSGSCHVQRCPRHCGCTQYCPWCCSQCRSWCCS